MDPHFEGSGVDENGYVDASFGPGAGNLKWMHPRNPSLTIEYKKDRSPLLLLKYAGAQKCQFNCNYFSSEIEALQAAVILAKEFQIHNYGRKELFDRRNALLPCNRAKQGGDESGAADDKVVINNAVGEGGCEEGKADNTVKAEASEEGKAGNDAGEARAAAPETPPTKKQRVALSDSGPPLLNFGAALYDDI